MQDKITNNIMIYRGESMSPIFSAADILHIEPYNSCEIRVGDVIVFRSPEDKTFITHRIISVSRDAIRTKGDNSDETDPWVLSMDDIIGKVVYARRGYKGRKIHGGFAGRAYCRITGMYKSMKNRTFSALSPVYHSLAERASCPFSPSGESSGEGYSKLFFTRLIVINKTGGEELQLLIGRYLIGRLRPKNSGWEIKRPFKIFINEKSLPKERGDIR